MPRDLTDDQIKRIAAKGGVVMINVGSIFLDQKTWDAFVAQKAKLAPEFAKLKKQFAKDPAGLAKAARALFEKQPKLPRTTLAVVVDHIEHVIKIGGADAVGFGTDFDGIDDPPIGLDDYEMLPAITEELLRRGHSETDVKKVLGENFLAFFARVEATKASLDKEPASMAVYNDGASRGKK